MATAKSIKKASPSKTVAAPAVTSASKAKPVTMAKREAKPKPAGKPAVAATAAKPARSRARKPAAIPPDQRRHYIEVAAYHIAERRGFAAGNPLDDWMQAEAEIDRLLAEGLLGR